MALVFVSFTILLLCAIAYPFADKRQKDKRRREGFVPTPPEHLEAARAQAPAPVSREEARRLEAQAEARRARDGILPGVDLNGGEVQVTYPASSGDPHLERHRVTAGTVAQLHESGSVTAVRGRNLAAKGAGGLLLGPAGLLLFGNAKTKVIDDRSWYLTLSDNGWNAGLVVAPELIVHARNFCARVNAAARALHVPATAADPTRSRSRVDELERLVALRAGGALTESEFEVEKRRVLGPDGSGSAAS